MKDRIKISTFRITEDVMATECLALYDVREFDLDALDTFIEDTVEMLKDGHVVKAEIERLPAKVGGE